MKRLFFSLTFLLLARLVLAVEGMWIPLLLGLLNEKEMQSLGMKMSAEDIYSVNRGSLKDAIVRFGRGCTSEIISPSGLLLTNHHCGYGQIQALTTLENNYLRDGFWAKTLKDELPNQRLTATLIVRIEDVTAAALQGVTPTMDKRTRQSTIDKNLDLLRKNTKKETYEELEIRPFFHGNQYFMFVTVTYRDVRLVGTPPESIGKFGADTDNWVWPRHTGDFALFRIYAGKDNLPADYSPDNVPYKPKHFLPISLDGVTEGDFTLVFGFPGRTNQYLPAVAVRQIVEVLDPARIAVRDKTLDIWGGAMRTDAKIKIQYASKQANLANAWKKWQGEVLGLTRTNAVQKKRDFENQFQKAVMANAAFGKYASLLTDFEKLYKDIEPYSLAKEYYDEITFRNVELLAAAAQVNRLLRVFEEEGEVGFQNRIPRLKNYLDDFYKNYSPDLDRRVFASLLEILVKKVDKQFLPEYLHDLLAQHGNDYEKLAASLFTSSWLTSPERAVSTLNLPSGDVLKAIQNDPACSLARVLENTYNEKVVGQFNQYNEQIEALQQTYMKALMEVFPNKRFYPDANSTLRCSYGKVQAYSPRDAVSFANKTYLEGVMEKYQPGDYEFDVPEKLRQLYEKKDYGPYAEGKKMPVCFIGSNHTTGGNSGSPAIDAHGNLIGLNFDRVWEGTMSDYYFDESLCRNIMVDIRYILFIIDKYAGAGHLIQEMKLVRPKQQQTPADKFKQKQKAEKPLLQETDH